MAQRFGAVFAIAIGSAALATVSCFALTARTPEGAASPEALDVFAAV